MSMGRPWRDYFSSEYLKGDALPDGGRTFTISGKARVEVAEKGETEHKLALVFTDGNKLLCNVTNATFIEHLFGSKDVETWIGRRVTLSFDHTVKFGTETVGGIRVIGSPDLTKPVEFMFQENSRKRPRKVVLVPTKETASEPSSTPAAVPSPETRQTAAEATAEARAAMFAEGDER